MNMVDSGAKMLLARYAFTPLMLRAIMLRDINIITRGDDSACDGGHCAYARDGAVRAIYAARRYAVGAARRKSVFLRYGYGFDDTLLRAMPRCPCRYAVFAIKICFSPLYYVAHAGCRV